MSEKKLSKEEYAKQMKERRNELYRKVDEGLLDISKSQQMFIDYLRLAAKIGYTVTNNVLVLEQNKNAVMLKDYAKWKESGYYVKRKEEAIQIIEPDGTFYRKDGSIATQYKVKSVFDVTQTNCKYEAPSYKTNSLTKAVIDGVDPLFAELPLNECILRECLISSDSEAVGKCVAYMIEYRYGVSSNENLEVDVENFLGGKDAKSIKAELQKIDTVFKSLVKKIDKQLYLQNQEKEYERQLSH